MSTLEYQTKLEVIDNITAIGSVGNATVFYSGFDKRGSIEDVKRAYFTHTLATDGTESGTDPVEVANLLDLTALVHEQSSSLESVDATGQKMLFFRFSCPSTNSGNVLVYPDDLGGYKFCGDGFLELAAGQFSMGGLGSGGPVVGSNKYLVLQGTEGDKIDCTLIFTNS